MIKDGGLGVICCVVLWLGERVGVVVCLKWEGCEGEIGEWVEWEGWGWGEGVDLLVWSVGLSEGEDYGCIFRYRCWEDFNCDFVDEV